MVEFETVESKEIKFGNNKFLEVCMQSQGLSYAHSRAFQPVATNYKFLQTRNSALLLVKACNFSQGFSNDQPTLWSKSIVVYSKGLERAVLNDDWCQCSSSRCPKCIVREI